MVKCFSYGRAYKFDHSHYVYHFRALYCIAISMRLLYVGFAVLARLNLIFIHCVCLYVCVCKTRHVYVSQLAQSFILVCFCLFFGWGWAVKMMNNE